MKILIARTNNLRYNSRITVTGHAEFAGPYANNMTLFEATGVGALLLTDYKSNLADMFVLDREAVAYRSPQECLEKVRYYLAHEAERESIARAGHERTMGEHTYTHRMRELDDILRRYLSLHGRSTHPV